MMTSTGAARRRLAAVMDEKSPGRQALRDALVTVEFALPRLLGETEFTMLFHQGVKESIHVAAVDEHAILLAIFDSRTTVGMVRLFAKEAGTAIGAILAETRTRPQRTGVLSTPLHKDEVQSSLRERPV